MMLAVALIRHSFVARHAARVEGRRTPWEHAVAGTLLLAGLSAWIAPAPSPAIAPSLASVPFADVQPIFERRCSMCHNPALAQKNVVLTTPERIKQHSQAVYQQVVVLKLMPFNNATQITDEERALIGRWYQAGAPIR